MTVAGTRLAPVRETRMLPTRGGRLQCWGAETTDSVDAFPDLRTVSSTPRWPSWFTMFVCTAKPSCTCATSPRRTVALPTVFTGISFSSWIVAGVPFRPMLYSLGPIFAVPVGNAMF